MYLTFWMSWWPFLFQVPSDLPPYFVLCASDCVHILCTLLITLLLPLVVPCYVCVVTSFHIPWIDSSVNFLTYFICFIFNLDISMKFQLWSSLTQSLTGSSRRTFLLSNRKRHKVFVEDWQSNEFLWVSLSVSHLQPWNFCNFRPICGRPCRLHCTLQPDWSLEKTQTVEIETRWKMSLLKFFVFFDFPERFEIFKLFSFLVCFLSSYSSVTRDGFYQRDLLAFSFFLERCRLVFVTLAEIAFPSGGSWLRNLSMLDEWFTCPLSFWTGGKCFIVIFYFSFVRGTWGSSLLKFVKFLKMSTPCLGKIVFK